MMQRARQLSDAIPPFGPIPSARRRYPPNHTTTSPAALPKLPLVFVGGPVVCYWHGCGRPAAVRVQFSLPSLLAGEVRNYCSAHAQQVSGARGAVLAGRLRVLKVKDRR